MAMDESDGGALPPVDPALEDAWRALRAARVRHAGANGADATAIATPDPEQLRAALAGELDDAQREAVLDAALRAGDHDAIALLHAARLAAAGAMAGTARHAPGHGASRASSGTRRRAPWVGASALVALAATVVVAVWLPKRLQVVPPPTATVRGEAAAVRLVAPDANAPARDTMHFVWHPLPDAARYALELLDSAGSVVQQVVTTDTTATVPLAGASRQATAWWVHATRADGTRVPGSLRLLAPRAAAPVPEP